MPLKVLLEVERLVVQASLVAAGIEVDVVRMGLDGILLVLQRVCARDQEDRVLAAHLADLGGIDELAPLDLHVLRAGGGLPVRLAERGLMDGLVADHLGDLLVGGVRLAAQEERRVAAVDDRLGILVIARIELCHGLQDDRDRDVARAGDRDGLLDVRQLADVGELVEDEVHHPRQLAVVLDVRAAAQDVDRLPHHDRMQEREGLVGIGQDGEDDHLGVLVAEPVELHLIVPEKLAHIADLAACQAHVAGDEDRLQRLARSRLELLVVGEGEVLVRGEPAALGRANAVGPLHHRGLVGVLRLVDVGLALQADDAALQNGVLGSLLPLLPLLGIVSGVLAVCLAGLDLLEEQIERRLVLLIVLACLCKRQQCEQAVERVVPLREPVPQKRDEGSVELPLRVLPKRVAARLLRIVRVHDEAVHEREDVGVGLHVGKRVVMLRFGEVDGVEGLHLVAVVREQPARLADQRSLRVRHEVVRVKLHEVRLHVVARLAGAGSAHDHHVQVAVRLKVEFLLLDSQAVFLCEDEVVRGVGLVLESQALLLAAPLGGPGLLAGAVVADEDNVAQPDKPNDGAQYEAVEQRHHVEVEVKRVRDEGLKAAHHLVPQLHVEPEDDVSADSVAKVEGDNGQDRRSKG